MGTRLAPSLWERGLAYGDYRASIANNGALFDEVYANPAFQEDDLKLLRALPPLRVVAVGEDWCPDVYNSLPTWARVAEELEGWELRVFARDQNLEIMDNFLWNTRARRIPVYAFYDRALALQVWWSGRGREAQAAIDAIALGRTYEEMDDEARAGTARVLREGYPPRFRRESFEEVLTLLRTFHHR